MHVARRDARWRIHNLLLLGNGDAKPDDQMSDEELNATQMLALDKLAELAQLSGFYDEPLVSNNPLVKP